jgi:translation initiation factor IF-2
LLLQVLREMRVKGQLMDHKEIKAAMGVKIVAPGLEHAVAGTSMYVVSALLVSAQLSPPLPVRIACWKLALWN